MEYPKTLFKYGEAKEVQDSSEEARAREQGYTEPYKFQEFPKSLHKGGDREKEEIVVRSAADEEEARKRGFKTIHERALKKEQAAA